jgi:pimeloyl-ACP methyl ester carboxylesterase
VVLVAVIAVAALFELVLVWAAVRAALPMLAQHPPFSVEQFPPDPGAEEVSIRVPGGYRLQGALFRSPAWQSRGLIIFCHECTSDRWSAAWYCEGLLRAGFDVLSFDFRNHGGSDFIPGYEASYWLSAYELEDVLAVIDYAGSRRDLSTLPLGLFGISRGGAAAIAAAARSPRVRAVVADGAYSSVELATYYAERWGRLYISDIIMKLTPRVHTRFVMRIAVEMYQWRRRPNRYLRLEKSLARLRRTPLLMIAGECDNYVDSSITQHLFSLTRQDPAGVWVVPGAKHNKGRHCDPEEYDARLVEFFSRIEPVEQQPAFAAQRALSQFDHNPLGAAAIAARDENSPARTDS